MSSGEWGWLLQCHCWELGLFGECQRGLYLGLRVGEKQSGIGFCVGSSSKQHPRTALYRI